MANIIIREAESEEDLEHLRSLLLEYLQHLVDVGLENICFSGYHKELSGVPERYSVLLMAFARTYEDLYEPAGCVLLQTIPLSRAGANDRTANELACEMKRLWVRPAYRNSGVGRLLAERLIENARQKGFTAMYLDTVTDKMQAANALYASLGFRPVARYNDNPVRDVAFFRLGL